MSWLGDLFARQQSEAIKDKPKKFEVGRKVWVAESGFRGSGYSREMYPGVIKDIGAQTYVVEVIFGVGSGASKTYFIVEEFLVERTA